MAKRFLLVVLSAALISNAVARAHEDQRHIMGTVARVTASELVVKTQNGRTVSILLTEDTVYRSIAEQARMGVMAKADIKPGTRVVVDGAGEGLKFTATQVRFSAMPKEAGDLGEQHHHPEGP